jgi:hypothetical protein
MSKNVGTHGSGANPSGNVADDLVVADDLAVGGDLAVTGTITGDISGYAVATDWTDGTDGTGIALLTFTKDGAALTAPIAGLMHASEIATGVTAAALDTGLSGAKGQVTPIASQSNFYYITNATGELDLTITSDADSYWLVFVQPDNTLLISDECAITGP